MRKILCLVMILSIGLIPPSLSLAAESNCPSWDDLPPNHLFYRYIQPLSCRGAIVGDDHLFHPNDPATRSVVARILVIGLGVPIYSATEPRFNDVSNRNPNFEYIETAARQGWLHGYTDGKFKPELAISRLELAMVLSRILDQDSSTNGPQFNDLSATTFGYAEVNRLSGWGIVSGEYCGQGLCYKPHASVKRGELCKMVYQTITIYEQLAH